MHRRAGAVGVLLVAGLAWWLLGRWVVGGSERFYLLVPPVFVALVAILAPDGRTTLRRHFCPALVYFGFVVLGCAAYGLYMVHLISPMRSGWSVHSFSLRETLVAAWFLVGLKLLLGAFLKAARRPFSGLAECVPGLKTAPGTYSMPRSVARNLLTEGPLLLLILPYVLAVLYVHRYKVPNPVTPQEALGRPGEDVAFTAADGLTIRGWLIPARQPSARTAVICHGLGANRSNFLPFVAVGDALRANVLLFDFRGHGDSDGHTVTFGQREQLDVLAAVDYLRRERPEEARAVIGVGISMGTAALIGAAAEVEPPLDAVILDSAFAAATELTDQILYLFPPPLPTCLAAAGVPLASLHAGCWLPAVRPIDQVNRLRAPVLFIHAAGDPLIPVEHARRLHARAAEPKALWVSNSTLHSGSLAEQADEYRQRVEQFVDTGGSP